MRLHRVRQRLVSRPIEDAAAEVRRRLDALNMDPPRGDIAITAGSRGITGIADIIRAVGDWLREQGASPFLVPCMGSHNGATAEGQRRMVESLGMTEDAMQMEIRSGMDTVKIGTVPTGDVHMDARCHAADGVLVVNRVKLHTCFSGTVQSGLTKMMVVGMGKIGSARTFHSAPTASMQDTLVEMGRVVLETGKVKAGLAILEDGFDCTAEIHALHPHEIPVREPGLLERHRRYFPRLPVEDIDVLVVDSIGKTFSGTGMDTNVIARRGVWGSEDLHKPDIRIIAALSLCEASRGNAIGVGLADFVTQHLRDSIDEQKTFINVFTTGDMQRAAIPAALANDETLVRTLRERFGSRGWVFIPNTLHLESLFISEDLRAKVAAHPLCEVDPEPLDLTFDKGRHCLRFETRDSGRQT